MEDQNTWPQKYLLSLYKKFFFSSNNTKAISSLWSLSRYKDNTLVIPNCIKDNNFPCSSGAQYRDFIYVDDVNDLIIKSLNNLEMNGKVLNVASGKAIKVKKVILDIKNIINKGNPEFVKLK